VEAISRFCSSSDQIKGLQVNERKYVLGMRRSVVRQQKERRLEKGITDALRNLADWSRSGLRTTFCETF
jgi:hypothetical protein